MENLEASRTDANDIVPQLLKGYRFSVCDTPEKVAAALDVRRRVYVDGVGYDVPVPDAYDHRSWLLVAEDAATGQAVGCMRLTPRFAGSFELEEYFTLPKVLRSGKAVEVNRFAILPEYRKGKTFLPIVSLGLFKTVVRFLDSIGADYMVVASKPEKIYTYEWIGFERTGRTAQYGALDAVEHELLSYEFRRIRTLMEGHPFGEFFTTMDYREVVLPRELPALGLGVDVDALPFELRQSA